MAIIYQLQRFIPYVWRKNSTLINRINSTPLLFEFLNRNNHTKKFTNREDHFHWIEKEIIKGERICYLEFGVYEGKSINFFASINNNPESKFYGFDTFEGLPEDWGKLKKGTFDTEGTIPKIKDYRINFIQGLFQETLRRFLNNFSTEDRLIIHLDADLYSSTMYVLSSLDVLLKSGDIIIFDEFSSVTHEFRAYLDYTSSFRRELVVLSMVHLVGWIYEKVAFIVK